MLRYFFHLLSFDCVNFSFFFLSEEMYKKITTKQLNDKYIHGRKKEKKYFSIDEV